MGSDRFVAIYGVKFDAPAEELESLSERWLPVARRAGLRTWSGRTTDRGLSYVVVGLVAGDLGVEGRDLQVALTDKEHARLSRDTRSKLAKAGVPGEPALHLLFEAQY